MFYQLRVDCFLKDQDSLNDVLEELEKRKENMSVVNPGLPQQELSTIKVIKCYHDENPLKPCELIQSWEVSA